MKQDDFRYIRRGKHLRGLLEEEMAQMQPIYQFGKTKNHALLVLHGFASSPAVYRELLPKLTAFDAIICPALPGHAESIESFSRTKAREWIDATTSLCEKLTQQYQQVSILGLSLGGVLACKLCQQFTIQHLYLLAPALQLGRSINPLITLARLLQTMGFKYIRNKAGNVLNPDNAEISYKKLPLNAIIEVLNLIKRHKWVAPTCPVDLFLGEKDPVIANQAVAALFSGLPHVTIHWLKNSAHLLPLDNDLGSIVSCLNA